MKEGFSGGGGEKEKEGGEESRGGGVGGKEVFCLHLLKQEKGEKGR